MGYANGPAAIRAMGGGMRYGHTRALARLSALLYLFTALLSAAPAIAERGERMVQIDVQIAEVQQDDLEKLGIDFSETLAGLQTMVLDPARTFVPPAGVLAAPTVKTEPGKGTSVRVGGQIPYTTGPDLGNFGIDLRVVPKIDPLNRVTLELAPTVSTVDLSTVPVRIGTRTMTTTVQIPNGQTTVLGGLLQSNARELQSRVPLIGDLPILGSLFSSRSFQKGQSELLIFITPRIFDEDGSVVVGGGGGATPTSTGGSSTPAAPLGLFYGQADYFGTQSEASRRPDFPLVTSKQLVLVDNPNTIRPYLGELDGPGTQTLSDESNASYGFASGFKASVGGWLGRGSDYGVEVGGFYVPSESTSQTLQSGQGNNSFFSVPFFDQARGFEYAVVIGSALNGQPASGGTVSVGSSLDFWGAGARVRARGYDCDDVELGFSAGLRYLRLAESFQIDYATDPTVAPFFGDATLGSYLFAGGMLPGAGSRVWAQDSVSARNDFYGLDLGLDAKVKVIPDLTLTISPRLAIGANRERLDTSGWGRAVDPAGNSYATPYGLFARPGAVGSRSETRFAVVPEIDLQFAYKITDCLELRLGYDFLFLSNMVYAGNQLSRSIDAPIDGVGAFSAQPTGVSRPFDTDTYWAQSFRAGIHVTF